MMNEPLMFLATIDSPKHDYIYLVFMGSFMFVLSCHAFFNRGKK